MICPLCKNNTLVYDTYDGKFKCNHIGKNPFIGNKEVKCNFITPSIFHDELQKLDELKVDAERTLNFVKPRIDYIIGFVYEHLFDSNKQPKWEEPKDEKNS